MNTLVLENEVQRILWEVELRAQISDGFWENSRPHDHYRSWCRAEVVIGDTPGRNFDAYKCNYNFTNPELLKAVGERMLFKVKAHLMLNLGAEDLGWDFPDTVSDLDEWQGSADGLSSNPEYWAGKIEALAAKGITQEVLDDIEAYPYTMKDLKKELVAIKKACRNLL